MGKDQYVPRIRRMTISREQRDLIGRRTIPFVRHGTHLSIEQLMAEAYVQGMRDALQVLDPSDDRRP